MPQLPGRKLSPGLEPEPEPGPVPEPVSGAKPLPPLPPLPPLLPLPPPPVSTTAVGVGVGVGYGPWQQYPRQMQSGDIAHDDASTSPHPPHILTFQLLQNSKLPCGIGLSSGV